MKKSILHPWAFARVCAFALLVGCGLNGSTKVAHGQLYSSGDSRYDSYFESVHREQVAAASWPGESKAARRPIVSALNLTPTASNTRIVSVTKDKKGEPSVGRAIEETSAAEVDRARKLNAVADKLEEMKRRGEELRKQAIEERRNMGADKADEKKAAHKEEIRRELSAAVDVTSDLASDARKAAKEAEELASKLRSVGGGKDEYADKARRDPKPPPPREPPPREPPPKEKSDEPKPVAKKPEKKSEPAIAKKHEARKSDEKKSEKSEEKKPQSAQKPPDEVFNP